MNTSKKNCTRTISHLRIMLTILLLGSTMSFVCAQNGSIKGVVIDTEDNGPVLGAVVAIEGTQTAIMTDLDGHYVLPKLKPGDYTLVVTYVGYHKETRKVKLEANEEKVEDFRLRSTTTLSEVVVTALGIERQEKALGYAVSKVTNEDINNTVSSNWLNGMSGKVAGLNFDQSSAGPGGSIRVTLRGEGSLSHDKNTALFVIDGVPINSNMTSNSGGGGYSNTDATIDYGNGASDLNPEDIESVSVLKGPAATALYGSRAGNGAIIITTKSGKQNKGIGVSISSSVTFEKAGFWPDFQTEYGAGNFTGATGLPAPFSNWTINDQYNNKVATRSWSRYQFGHKYDGSLVYSYGSRDWNSLGRYGEGKMSVPTGSVLGSDGYLYTPQPYVAKDWYKGFFETGTTWNNSVSIDANNGKGGTFRLSIKDTRNSWIIPNTGYDSQNISLSATQEASKYIKLDTKITYYRKNSDNLPMAGYSTNSPLYALIWSPAETGIQDYKDEYFNDRINYIYENSSLSKTALVNQYNDNPYFMVYEQLNAMSRDRVYGNTSIDITFIPKKLSLLLRAGMDFTSDFRTQQKPYYSVSSLNGFYREQTVKTFESNIDFLLNYKDRFGDFDVSAFYGGNTMYSNYQNIRHTAEKLLEKNIYTLSNVDGNLLLDTYRSKKGINSFYGSASVGWKSTLYLEVTGRNDWSSTLPSSNRSYFYPSVNTSVLFDQLFNFRKNLPWMDLLKLRASWANVGNDTDAYQLIDSYATSDFSGAYKLYPTKLNSDLKPENVESWELGLETRLLNNRLGLDFTYYDAATTDQIIEVPSDWLTGAYSRKINAGKVTNKGIEIGLRVEPIRTKDWKWDINFNWSKNWNKLVELADGVEMWQLNASNTIGSRVFVYAYPGQELGRIYGYGYEQAPEGAYYIDESGNKVDCSGQTIVTQSTGNPVIDQSNLKDLGSIYPNWKGGINQTISYKDLSMSMSFAFQSGGRAYSVTNFALAYMGKLNNSLEGRYDGLIHEGVNRNEDGTYSKNTTITTNIVDYYATFVYARNNVENNVFSTSYFKMKELRLDYRIPKKVLTKAGLKFVQSLQIGGYATNLFCITDWPQYDPDVASFSGSSLNRGVETGGYPMTRTYGVNLRVSF